MNRVLRLLFLAGIGLPVLWSLQGCLKTNGNTPVTSVTYLNFMHMAPWSQPAQIYLNDQASSGTIYPLTWSTQYSPLEASVFDVKIKKANSDSVMASLSSALYDSSHYYTLITYNSSPTKVSMMRVEDQFNRSSTDKVHWRFWHLGPDAPNVDLYMDTILLSGNRQFTDNLLNSTYNDFQDLDAGYHTFSVKEAGTSNLLAQAVGNDFLAGNYYSIFLYGVVGSADQPLQVDVLRAAQ